MPTHSEQRFYRDGRKVMDREKSSYGPVFCTARSGHAAEMIQHALNNWAALGPTKTPKMTSSDYAQRRRLQALKKTTGEFDPVEIAKEVQRRCPTSQQAFGAARVVTALEVQLMRTQPEQ